MKLSEWIKAARTQAELTQSDLGDKLGRTKGNVSAWEKGSHEPSYQQVLDIALITNTDMALPCLNAKITSDKKRQNHITLPVMEVSPSAGAGKTPVDYPAVIDYLEVPEAWAKYKLGKDLAKYRLLPVSGDSMSPTINDGDIAFVDTGTTAFDTEGIYMIVWNDRLLIKRLRASLTNKRIEICSDNINGYKTETVSLDELSALHICGLVKCWWSIKSA